MLTRMTALSVCLPTYLTLPYNEDGDPAHAGFPSIIDRLWGRDVACGNITGGGQDEIVVAAYNADIPGPNVSNNGWVRVFVDGNVANTIDMRRPGGDAMQADFGWAIKIGDYNNDSYRDVLISAPYDDQAPARGEVYLYLGGANFPVSPILYQRPEPFGIAMDKFGSDVDFLNDQDGDGYADLVFGGPFFGSNPPAYGPGRAWVKRGGISSWSWMDDPSVDDLSPIIWGWGSFVATGKLDNNANLDIAIGNPRAAVGASTHAGEVRVVIYQ